MPKQPSSWKRQGQTRQGVGYADPSINYDDPDTAYGSSQTSESVIKNRSSWARREKIRSIFSKNAAANVLRQIFDAHEEYDQHLTYDSIVVGEPRSTTKKPRIWSPA